MADATLLSWINTEVERALLLVRDSIARFTAAPEDREALRPCPEHLHQVSGALRMVGLSGATLVCETIEGSFAGFAEARPSAAALGVIDRAVLALKDFVGDLARGQADAPLRLFPVYRDLAQLKGATAAEKDLFFPDVSLKAPPHRRPKTLKPDSVNAFVQKQRTLFQRGLVAWLRNPPAGLDDMRRAVNQLHKIAAQLPEPQAVWWVAGGLFDALEQAKDPEWLASAKALGNRIEKQMRGGEASVTEALLREMLYAIAKSPANTPRLKEIRGRYQLESLFPRPEPSSGNVLEFDIERLEVALYDLHSRLDALKRTWVQYVAGEPKAAATFRERVTAFRAKAKDLGNQHLLKLLDAIGLVATRLPDPYPRQTQSMVIEMASAFLLVEHVLDNFANPSPELEQQIAIMGGWLLDAATGKSSGEPPAGLRPDLSERIGALHLRSHVAKEILANLQHVEQVLDAFSRDASKRATLPELRPYLRQMHGALVVLGLMRAAQALAICESLIDACAKPAHPGLAEDMDWIAEGLSSIGFFLEPCRDGREPAEEAISLFFRRYEKRNAPVSPDTTVRLKLPLPAAPSGASAAPAAAAEPRVEPTLTRPGVDPSLLEVFLEEAGEVLDTIRKTVPACRARPEDRESLTVVRRGFHTLKGSGRMVGLMDLGEVAWDVERTMNRWLEEKRPATPELLELVTEAAKSFAGWIDALRKGSLQGEVDGAGISALAASLLLAAPPASPAPSRAEAPAPDQVSIGGVTLARSFFEIYAKEAAEHAATLEAQSRERDKLFGAEASHEFARAAHTLASSSRTAGFARVADLAAALEAWTAFAPQTTKEADVGVVQAAIRALRAMVDAIGRREAPQAGEAEGQRLRQLAAWFEAHPAPPVVTPAEAGAAAAAPAAKPAGGEKRILRDDIDPQLLPFFLEESQELVPHIGSDLRDWKASPADTKISDSLRRLLHTFKGNARMAGAIRLGELCHLMESRIEAALEAQAFPPALFEDLEEKMDRLSLDVERFRPAPAAGAPAAAPVAEAAQPAQPAAAAAAPAAPAPRPSAAQARLDTPATPAALLRVNADTLDHLINQAGEVVIARSRIESELRSAKQALAELGDSIARLRGQLREVEIQADSQMQSRASVLEERNREFDPLEFDRYTRLQELTRMMAESLNDVTSIQQSLFKSVGDTDAALLQQARISRDVQQDLMRVRAVPFSALNERLYRVVRQTAREIDKKAELAIEGGEVELDRSVLERIGAPLEHLLRNALAHGIEAPAARAAAGKPEAGRITISLRQESNEIALLLADDGAGLDLERLKQRGVERGLVGADETSEAKLAQLVFASGLSTAEAVTELAGRGVGMDVVRNEIAAIGGRVDIETKRGQGTTFALHLPLTLAVTQALLVRGGDTVLAVSAAMVEQVLRLKPEQLAELYRAGMVVSVGRTYPLHYVRHLLGGTEQPASQPYNSVLLVRSGIQRVALHVDELAGNQEVVVKAIGPQVARLPGVVGATVLPTGAIALIMNPVQLAQRAAAGPRAEAAAVAAPQATPTVMVVDDSLTVRRVTSRLLEREGYQVVTAKDGVEALERVREALPAVMLVDIEMPRMDGFDLARNLGADPRTQNIPIIIISSRTAGKHREQAEGLGIKHFLGKPYPEAELLQLVAQYVSATATASAAIGGAASAAAA
jgi:chemosensory pili system protein ChpA (sensor histidine kinase/response regulator)